MNIRNLFGIFGKSNEATVEGTVKEPIVSSKNIVVSAQKILGPIADRLNAELNTPKFSGVVEIFEGKWGYYSVSYETFLKLKELHKWYHKTLRHLGTWVRWDRKTVHQHGPEPKYCSIFVHDRASWWHTEDKDGNSKFHYYPKTRVDHGICEAFHSARMPKDTPEKVEPLEISLEEVDRLHAEASAWFTKNC